MSRVALPTGSLWISFKDAGRAPHAEKPAESGYPPYNIELLPRDEGEPTLLRITFAVAGFRLEDLDVTVEDGQLIVHGTRARTRARTISTGALPPVNSSGVSISPMEWWPTGPNCITVF
jgi:HSP20 family molecular chaperone IbpA